MPRLVLIACAAAVAALFVLIPAGEAFSFPIIEFASGAGTVTDSSFGGSTLTFSFNASSGPTSENVSGTFSFDLSATAYQPDEKWSGNVTCLFVQGSEATMGLLVTASANPQMPVG
jgi:hypothetical protein